MDPHTAAMPQSLARILVHAVFSTQGRRPFLQKMTFRSEVHCYLGGILKHQGCEPIEIGGIEDHVHILSTLSRTASAFRMSLDACWHAIRLLMTNATSGTEWMPL